LGGSFDLAENFGDGGGIDRVWDLALLLWPGGRVAGAFDAGPVLLVSAFAEVFLEVGAGAVSPGSGFGEVAAGLGLPLPLGPDGVELPGP